MINKVYIIIYSPSAALIYDIESVWTTKESAEAAVQFHAYNSHNPTFLYRIIERELNVTRKTE